MKLVDPFGNVLVLLGVNPVNFFHWIPVFILEIHLLLGYGGELLSIVNRIGEVQDFTILGK